jgi:hypothetical protein
VTTRNERVPNQVVPNPDPSEVTSDAIDRRVENIKEVLDAKIDGMAKAVEVFQADLTRVPTQLDRAVAGLRDLVEARMLQHANDLQAIKELVSERSNDRLTIINTRFEGMDKAIKLLHDQQEGRQQAIDATVNQLRSLHDERFNSIGTQFTERDRRVEQLKEAADTTNEERFKSIQTQFTLLKQATEQLDVANKTAIAAALQAQKESAGETQKTSQAAIAKSETSTSEAIKALTTTFNVAISALTDRYNDLKGRMDRGEGKDTVMDPAISAQLDRLTNVMHDLKQSRDIHSGGEKTATDSSARMLGVAGLMIGVLIGVGEIIVRIAVH